MNPVIKLSSPATSEFWEIPILHEDADLLALGKPARLLVSPDRYDPARPNLMKLLHADIERGAPWARHRGISYLMNAHRLDFETTGVILLARNKPALVALADQFGNEKPLKVYAALVVGSPPSEPFEIDAPLAPHPLRPEIIRVDEKRGKRAVTAVSLRERFRSYALMECRPRTGRTHQIRVHLQFKGHPIVGDTTYGGSPLLLSSLKSEYRLKPKQTERPLLHTVALHAEKLQVTHPVSQLPVQIEAPWPKDLLVAVKYLRRYAPAA